METLKNGGHRLKSRWKFKTKVYTAATEVIPRLIYSSGTNCCNKEDYDSHTHTQYDSSSHWATLQMPDSVPWRWPHCHIMESPLLPGTARLSAGSQPTGSTGIPSSAGTWSRPEIRIQWGCASAGYAIFEKPVLVVLKQLDEVSWETL